MTPDEYAILDGLTEMKLTGSISDEQFRMAMEHIMAQGAVEEEAAKEEDKDTQQGLRYRKGYEDGIMDLEPQADDAWYMNGHRDGLGDRELSLAREEIEQAEAQEEINEWLKWREKRHA